MGVLTDLIIADKNEAETVANSPTPWSEWKGFDAKGHNEITLGTLDCILRGADFSQAHLIDFPFLATASDEGPWVFEVPNELLLGLTRLDNYQITAIAAKWLETEEMDSATQDYAEDFIKEFQLLAKEAIDQNKPILMWTSL